MSKKLGPQNAWEHYPVLKHLAGSQREMLEERRRLRKVRYFLFRLQNQVNKEEPLEVVEGLPPGFIEFWLGEEPRYAINPKGERIPVPNNRQRPVADLGGYKSFAKVWDVDSELFVYIRHRSVWQEWNTKLQQAVPILGDD